MISLWVAAMVAVTLWAAEPVMPNPLVNLDELTATVEWEGITSDTDGGQLDPSDVTYTVWLDNVIVAESLTACSYSHTFAAPNGCEVHRFGTHGH